MATNPWDIPGLSFSGNAPNILQIASNFPAALSQMTPGASAGAAGINTANQTDLLNQIRSVLPTGAQSLRTLGSQADQMLQGIIPEDVQRAIMDSSAGKALMLGVSGSPAATYDEARTLGLTSLDLIGRGAGLLGQATDLARRGYMPQQVTAETLMPGIADVYNNQLQQWIAKIQKEQNAAALAAGQGGINQGSNFRLPGSIGGGAVGGIKPLGPNPDFASWGAGGGGGGYGTAPAGGGFANVGTDWTNPWGPTGVPTSWFNSGGGFIGPEIPSGLSMWGDPTGPIGPDFPAGFSSWGDPSGVSIGPELPPGFSSWGDPWADFIGPTYPSFDAGFMNEIGDFGDWFYEG